MVQVTATLLPSAGLHFSMWAVEPALSSLRQDCDINSSELHPAGKKPWCREANTDALQGFATQQWATSSTHLLCWLPLSSFWWALLLTKLSTWCHPLPTRSWQGSSSLFMKFSPFVIRSFSELIWYSSVNWHILHFQWAQDKGELSNSVIISPSWW